MSSPAEQLPVTGKRRYKRTVGRPTLLMDWMPRIAGVLARLGAINRDYAEAFDVDERTIEEWMASDGDFSRAVKCARADADARVERSLFERATGYSHPEEKIFCNSYGEVTRVETRMQYPPDTKAAQLWLLNRRPEQWRNRSERVNVDAPGAQLSPDAVVDNLVALAQRHPIAREPLLKLLRSAIARLEPAIEGRAKALSKPKGITK